MLFIIVKKKNKLLMEKVTNHIKKPQDHIDHTVHRILKISECSGILSKLFCIGTYVAAFKNLIYFNYNS